MCVSFQLSIRQDENYLSQFFRLHALLRSEPEPPPELEPEEEKGTRFEKIRRLRNPVGIPVRTVPYQTGTGTLYL